MYGKVFAPAAAGAAVVCVVTGAWLTCICIEVEEPLFWAVDWKSAPVQTLTPPK